jgi:hypothetical protein
MDRIAVGVVIISEAAGGAFVMATQLHTHKYHVHDAHKDTGPIPCSSFGRPGG